MRALFRLFPLLLAIACGGKSPTQPPATPTGKKSIAAVAGNNQTATIVSSLGQPLTAQAYLDTTHGASMVRMSLVPTTPAFSGDTQVVFNLGPALKGVVVSFVVPDQGFGRAFAGAAITDSLGIAKDRWVGGTKAGCSTMEARLVDQVTGAPITVASFNACWRAHPVVSAVVLQRDTLVHVGDTLNLRGLIYAARDEYDNLNTDYRLAYRNYDSVRNPGHVDQSDPVPIVSDRAVIKAGATHLEVHLDSLIKFIPLRVVSR